MTNRMESLKNNQDYWFYRSFTHQLQLTTNLIKNLSRWKKLKSFVTLCKKLLRLYDKL